MGASIDWRTPRKYKPLEAQTPGQLAKVLALESTPRLFSEEDLPYLRGLSDGGLRDAGIIVGLITTHGAIELRAQW